MTTPPSRMRRLSGWAPHLPCLAPFTSSPLPPPPISLAPQILLLISGGALVGILPVMFAMYVAMAWGWLRSVDLLSLQNNYGHPESVDEDLRKNQVQGGRGGGDEDLRKNQV